MWPWASHTKESAQSVKTLWIGCGRYKIRKLNPLLDFKPDDMPQIFTAYQTRRKQERPSTTEAQLVKAQRDMMNVVEAGLVYPELVPIGVGDKRGKEGGITVEDIFREPVVGEKLYWEVVLHSLNRFKGIKGVFFSTRLRYLLYTVQQKTTEENLSKYFSPTESTA